MSAARSREATFELGPMETQKRNSLSNLARLRFEEWRARPKNRLPIISHAAILGSAFPARAAQNLSLKRKSLKSSQVPGVAPLSAKNHSFPGFFGISSGTASPQ